MAITKYVDKRLLDEALAQNAELVAQVALLCEKLKDIEDTESDKPYVYRLQAKQALRLANDSPAQHLRDIQADAGLKGYFKGTDDAWKDLTGGNSPEQMTAHKAIQYAERVKAGE